ncbi:MAG: RidA family protein [Luminiphilus sp.]|nr:RidA family protein [Luminiphilus sp.]MDG2037264.1 RidA family protein [Luminiphilus sp.]
MAIEPIQLDPDPLAPFRISPGFKVDGILYLSGHAAISESGELMGIGDFDAQAEATFESLNRTLRAGGSDLSQVIKVTIYLTDMSHFDKIVALREKWFTQPYPADTIVEVSSLALPELMIEIEAIAAAN